jgi:hypothetical protein
MNAPETANEVLVFFLACIVKVTVVWAIAIVVGACLRRAAAASRHFVWAAAALASLALPILMLALPAWRSTMAARAEAILTPAHRAAVAQPPANASAMNVDAASVTFHVAPWLIALWAICAIALGLRLFFRLAPNGGCLETSASDGRLSVATGSPRNREGSKDSPDG